MDHLPSHPSTALHLVRVFHDLRQIEHDLRHWPNGEIPKNVNADARIRLLAQYALSLPDDIAHGQRVGRLARMLSATLGWSNEEAADLEVAATMHDFGKIAVDPRILNKAGALSTREQRTVRAHCALGGKLLGPVRTPLLTLVRDVILGHHERWDGAGYPDGRHSITIPEAARLVAIVDVYDALTSDRPYRPAYTHTAALQIIASERGHQFDPHFTDAFLTAIHCRSAETIPDTLAS